MKKYFLILLIFFVILITSFLFLFKNNNSNLKKIKVADTTITSRKYMSWFNLYILKKNQTKYAVYSFNIEEI